MEKQKTERISVRLTRAKIDVIKKGADGFGMSVSAFGGMLMWMGYKLWQRQVNPEEIFTPDQWAKIGEAMGQLEENGENDG